MAQIRIFVSCHKPFPVPDNPLLVPVQVGSALAGERFPGFRQDDEGENISEKNRSYCELTAQYWAWKNVEADYYGFFHYRRYLYPDLREKRPYRIWSVPSEALLDRLGYAEFPSLIERYDILAPKGEDMRMSVRAHYAQSAYHRENDLAMAVEAADSLDPAGSPALMRYLDGTIQYFGNLFIMSCSEFDAYCRWLFPILEEFDRRVDFSGRSAQEIRVDGYLAERLFGAYYTRRKDEGANTLTLPRMDFLPDPVERTKRKLLYTLLTPGSRVRACVKRIMKG